MSIRSAFFASLAYLMSVSAGTALEQAAKAGTTCGGRASALKSLTTQAEEGRKSCDALRAAYHSLCINSVTMTEFKEYLKPDILPKSDWSFDLTKDQILDYILLYYDNEGAPTNPFAQGDCPYNSPHMCYQHERAFASLPSTCFMILKAGQTFDEYMRSIVTTCSNARYKAEVADRAGNDFRAKCSDTGLFRNR